MMVTLPLWLYVVSVIIVAYGMYVVFGIHVIRWMVSDAGPWSDRPCPTCLRPHDSEARRLQRQLHKMHENYARLDKCYAELDKQAYAHGYAVMEAIGKATSESQQNLVREDPRVRAAVDAWTRFHNHGGDHPGPSS